MSIENLSSEERDALAMIGAKAYADPKLRKQFLKIVKQIDPTTSIPEVDMDDEIEKFTAKSDARVEALEQKLREKEARERLNELRSAPVRAGLVEEHEVDDLEKYMKENGFAVNQYMQAAKLRQAEAQIAEPTPSDYRPLSSTLPDDDELRKNPSAWAQKMAHQTINEFKKRTFRA